MGVALNDVGLVSPGQRPTGVRHMVIGVTAVAAFLMYLDRMCLSQMVAADSFQRELGFGKAQMGPILGTFFLAYALAQIPSGYLADRIRIRTLFPVLIVIWSAFTILTGFSVGFWSLMFSRVGCGIAEAGAYPISSKVVSRWIPLYSRGRANAVISAGGRLGGAFAPFLTAIVIGTLHSWRAPGWVYGAAGILFAGIFWMIFRDNPAEHPGMNAAERNLIERDIPASQLVSANAPPVRTPWRALLTSPGMWLMCLYQNLTNVGWVFLVTLMPTYLKQVKGMNENDAGFMSSIALLIGMAGMLSGGWLTDTLTRRMGQRQGRMIPLAWSRFIGAAAYVLCLFVPSPWFCVAMFAIVAAMTDLSIPATWGYVQDVGGRSVAVALAWPNMWGNLGAAITPSIILWINNTWNWNISLLFSAAAFLVSGFVAFGIRADVALEPEKIGSFCSACGYDLRATPQRCPECGTIPEAYQI